MARAPWYTRQEFWIGVATLVVPFFWILPISRPAYARVTILRDRRI